jgi:multiple sugar transport system ATP-binding protein
MVRYPEVFLLDEPLSNLDAKLRTEMRSQISTLHQKLQTTFVYVTHDQTEAMTLGTRIVVMKDGVVQQIDTPTNLYNKPGNLFVAGFIGSPQMNFFDAVCNVNGSDVDLQIGHSHFPVPADKAKKLIDGGYAGKTVVLGIRPEDVHEATEADKAGGKTIPCTIKFYELLGAEVFLYFDLGDQNITARVDPSTTARTNSEVTMAINMDHIHIFDKDTEEAVLN